MIHSTLSYFRRRGKALASSVMILSLAGTSFLFTSCTTEEGILAGALAGAAVGGLVGHSHETAYKRGRSYNRNYGGGNYRGGNYRGGNYRGDNYRGGNYRGGNYGGGYYNNRYSSYNGGGYGDDYCY